MNKLCKCLIVALLGLILPSCKGSDSVLYVREDLNGSSIAILDHAISNQDFCKMFPNSERVHFKSSSEFLLAMSIGKCDAGLAKKGEGQTILRRNSDYLPLPFPELQNDSVLAITHARLLPIQRVEEHNGDVFDRSFDRIYRSVISDGYWMLILRGLATTVTIFTLGFLMAFALAILLQWMNGIRYLGYFSRPLSYFIKKIHDVPSIVLIFFFYYVVFASSHISGILVCAISLAVYTSSSYMNIFTIHLKEIDRNQHDAAQMLGLTGWNKYRYVILPQALRPMVPLLAGESKVLLRATTYAGYISEFDLVKVTEIIRNQTYDVLIPLLLASVVFLVLSNLIKDGMNAFYNKVFKYD
ncbi:MAG: ABC transporter permease subunit [Bacteroidales bacterium]|nr:ABC transporter permease subunit [Bacteroidales bacterium]